MLWNTPSEFRTKYSKAMTTNSTTQPTSDSTKLNFITDQGSILAMTSCASRRDGASSRRTPGVACFGTGGAAVGLLLTVTALPEPPFVPSGRLASVVRSLRFVAVANGAANLGF